MSQDNERDKSENGSPQSNSGLKRRELLLGSSTLLAASSLLATGRQGTAQAQQPAPAAPSGQRPNIVIIWGDDIGLTDVSAYSQGLMGFHTPNIDRIAREGVLFTDYYGEQSCTAGRASFITGQSGLRTGLTKVGLPGATLGLQKEDPTIAELLKPLGYATGQFGKNHLGDRNEFLPTVHGFDEFYGNFYHLNAEEEPELPDYPKDPAFRAKYGPRAAAEGRQAVLCLGELYPHALPYPHQAREHRSVGALGEPVPRHHDRSRQECRHGPQGAG